MAITSTPIFINSKKKPSKSNPDTEPMFDAVADFKQRFGWQKTIEKLEMMTEVTKKRFIEDYDSRLREQEIDQFELMSAEFH